MLKLKSIILMGLLAVSIHQDNSDSKQISIYSKDQAEIISYQLVQQVLSLDSTFAHQKQSLRFAPNNRTQASLGEDFRFDQYSIWVQIEFYDSEDLAQEALKRLKDNGHKIPNLGDEAYSQVEERVILRKDNVFIFVEVKPKKTRLNISKDLTEETKQDEQNEEKKNSNQTEPLNHYEYTPLPADNSQIERKTYEPSPELILAQKIAESVVKVLDEYSK